jgi:hypothetical protein
MTFMEILGIKKFLRHCCCNIVHVQWPTEVLGLYRFITIKNSHPNITNITKWKQCIETKDCLLIDGILHIHTSIRHCKTYLCVNTEQCLTEVVYFTPF